MEHQDVRAKILEDAYNRTAKGTKVMNSSTEYAKLLDIPEEQAFFNLRYLIKASLLEGHVQPIMGGQEYILVTGISPLGIEAVENPRSRGTLAVNWSIINFQGSVKDSQISIGSTGSPQTKVDVKDSPGARVSVGPQGQQPVSVHPYTPNEAAYIRLGKILMMRWFHALNHSLTPFAYIAVLFSGLFGGSTVLAYLGGTSVLWNPIVLVWLTATLVLAAIFWGSWNMGNKTECDSCHAKFSLIRQKRTLVGHKELREKSVRNYEDVYVCTNCGYTKRGSSTEEIAKPTED